MPSLRNIVEVANLVFVLHAVIEAQDVAPAGHQPFVVVHHVLKRLPVLKNVASSSSTNTWNYRSLNLYVFRSVSDLCMFQP